MSAIIDDKYISYASVYLRNFSKRGSVYNFSCHICGDSQVDKRKARGYLINTDGDWFYKCHNCSAAYNFSGFLKSINEDMYSNYRMESFRESTKKPEKTFKEKHSIHNVFATVNSTKLSDVYISLEYLDDDHKAIQYCKKREIPKEYYNTWFYSTNLNLISKIFEDYNDKKFPEADPRIIIPVYRDGELKAIIARSLDPKTTPKYIILKKNKNEELLYSKNQIDINKPVYVVEGPIDSLFIDNCLAVMGSDLKKCIEEYPSAIYIFDNQPRNKEIIKLMEKLSESVKMVIWPSTISQKDINEMHCDKIDYKSIIENNTFSGIKLKLRLAQWRKI